MQRAYCGNDPPIFLQKMVTMQPRTAIVLCLLMLWASSIGLSAEELPDDEPTEPIDTLTVADVIQHWTDAVSEIHRVDVEFVQYEYDLTYETTRVADGRLVCEAGSRQFMSFQPHSANIKTPRLKRSGEPFDVRPAIAERWIMHHGEIWEIDDDDREAFMLKLRSNLTQCASPNSAPKQSIWESFVSLCGHINLARFETTGQFVGPVQISESGVPMLRSKIESRFTITITKTNATHVYLHLVSQFQQDSASYSSIDVKLSRETWLPDAVQFVDPAGTKLTSYVIKQRRVNDCAETFEELFDPDLTEHTVFKTDGATAAR